jgi:DNA-binding transcriptional ArsR family regulator
MAGECDVQRCLNDMEGIRKQMLSRKNAIDAANRLKLLAHPTRLQILRILSEGDQCVCIFSKALGKRQPNISQHLTKLKGAGAIESYMQGKYAYYRLKDKNTIKLLNAL